MGLTLVFFQGRRFQTSDAFLEIWLNFLVEEIDAVSDPPCWMKDMRDEWHIQSTQAFGFGVIPGIDNFVTDENRKRILIDLSERALMRLDAGVFAKLRALERLVSSVGLPRV